MSQVSDRSTSHRSRLRETQLTVIQLQEIAQSLSTFCSTTSERGEKVNHRLSRKDQISIIRLRSGHHQAPRDPQSARCCVLEMWYGEETVEHVMGECSSIHNLAIQLPEPYLIATNLLKALVMLGLWKAKPGHPRISQLAQLGETVSAAACSTTTAPAATPRALDRVVCYTTNQQTAQRWQTDVY